MQTLMRMRSEAINQDLATRPSGGISSEKRLSSAEYDFAKSYIHGVYSGRVASGEIHISRCVGISSSHRPQKPNLIDTGVGSIPLVGDAIVMATISWRGEPYEVSVSQTLEYGGERSYAVHCLGLSAGATSAKELLDHLLKESIANSPYRNQILQVSWNPMSQRAITVKPVKIDAQPLSNIILQDEVRGSIELMIETIKHYPQLRTSLRYLLEGEAGCGKTETTRAVIRACEGFITVLIVESTVDVVQLFDYAQLYEPSLVCIDDLDIQFGDRHEGANREQLAEFLTAMDGIRTNSVFVLGTINRKQYLDAAASRPHRWDAILKISGPDSLSYLKLIKQRCQNEQITELFTPQVIESMASKTVTGAFVVTLLKRLELSRVLTPERLNEDFVLMTIDQLSKGFKRASDGSDTPVGFGAN
ncbi:MAG: ATP-binding protein [Ignavibacteriales bacterium]|nr:ATP-binding protein [Ignavibacteriales bacterium]